MSVSGTVIDVMRTQLVLNKIMGASYHAKHHFVCVYNCVRVCVKERECNSLYILVVVF